MRIAWILVASMMARTALAEPVQAKMNFKAPPDAAEIAKMSPGNYYRALVDHEYRMVEETVARVRLAAASGDEADRAQSYDNLEKALGKARSRLVGWPAYKDEDGRLRDAVINAYKAWGALCIRERDDAAPLSAEIPKNDAHMRSYEKIRLQLEADWEASNEEIRTVIDAFAEENRLVFVAPDDIGADDKAFEADLPPKTELSDTEWVRASIRYHNALFELAGAMVQSISKAAEKMNTMDLEAARVEALGEIKPSLKEAKAFGPLGGSSAFRDAVVSYGDRMVNQLEGPIKEYAEVTKTGSVTAEQAEHLKSLGEAFTNEGGSKAAALQSARGQFMSDWHFEGYMAWQDTKKKKK